MIKTILITDSHIVKLVENAPEKVQCECDEIDGAGDFEDTHYRCEKRVKEYEAKLKIALDNAIPFEDQEAAKDLLPVNGFGVFEVDLPETEVIRERYNYLGHSPRSPTRNQA